MTVTALAIKIQILLLSAEDTRALSTVWSLYDIKDLLKNEINIVFCVLLERNLLKHSSKGLNQLNTHLSHNEVSILSQAVFICELIESQPSSTSKLTDRYEKNLLSRQ